MKKILITGANGFVGTNLCERLSKDPSKIFRAMIMENTPIELLNLFKKENAGENLEIVYGNLLDLDSLMRACNGIHTIVHLAGLVTDWAAKQLYFKIIVEGTQNLLLAASKMNVKRMIFMSSLTVHALSGHNIGDENTPRDMKSFAYGIAKRDAEDLVQKWAEENESRDYAVVRPGFTIYGKYDKGSFVNAIDAIVKGKFGFLNKGKSLISYVYSENLAYGLDLLISAEKINGAYIVMDGNMTWKEFVDEFSKEAKSKPIKTSIPYGLIAPIVILMVVVFKLLRIKRSPPLNMYRISIPRKHLAFSDKKIRDELGYNPPISFKESIKKTMEFYHSDFEN
jgi:nucleoside-diphosphate-sugar epimerase